MSSLLLNDFSRIVPPTRIFPPYPASNNSYLSSSVFQCSGRLLTQLSCAPRSIPGNDTFFLVVLYQMKESPSSAHVRIPDGHIMGGGGGGRVESIRIKRDFFLKPITRAAQGSNFYFLEWMAEKKRSCDGQGGRAAPLFCVIISLKRRVHAVHGRVVRPKPTGILNSIGLLLVT